MNTKKNVFYSAYLTDRIQFNNVDEDKVIQLTEKALDEINNMETQAPSEYKLE